MNIQEATKKAAAKINENIEYEVTTLYEVLAKEKTTYIEMLDTVKHNKPFNHDEIQLTIYSKLIEKIKKEALSKSVANEQRHRNIEAEFLSHFSIDEAINPLDPNRTHRQAVLLEQSIQAVQRIGEQ